MRGGHSHPGEGDTPTFPQLSPEIQVGVCMMMKEGWRVQMHDYILLLHDSAVPASPCACLESGFALEWYGTPQGSINKHG